MLLTFVISFWFADVSSGQTSQFAFDRNGNFITQTGATPAAPQILHQPQDQIAAPGSPASFSVAAANTAGLTYQWRFHGTNLPGATGDSLLITNVSSAHAGPYSVALANSSGSIVSAPATLMLDNDRDGLPDSWEQTYFGGLGQRSASDFDNDGVSNRDEWLDGTNPADSASVLFRLTIVSDGGNVSVSPGRFSFTNGEVVTLTATAIAPDAFHGWRGATNTTTNPISLTMDGNKTVYAYLSSYDITWTNNASGDWNVASNWSPDFVPATNDNVIISKSVTVTLNNDAAIGALTLSGPPTLAGSGNLLLQRDSSWSGGTMTGNGRTLIPPGVALTISGSGSLTGGRILENGGTTFWSSGNVVAATGTVITNRAGALFEVQGAGTVTAGLGGGRFDNSGTFRKSSSGTTSVQTPIPFNNYGVVELQSGTLSLGGGGLNQGTIHPAAGATLQLAGGTFTASAGSSIAGPGNLTLIGATANLAGLVNLSGTYTFTSGTANFTGDYFCTNNTVTIATATANFSGNGTVTPAILNQSGGTLSGTQPVTVLNQMTWSGGTMTGSSQTLIPPGVTLSISGSASLTGGRTLENGGTTFWNSGNIVAATGTVITNRVGALFQVQGAGTVTAGLGGGRFDNSGTFRKSSSGTTSVQTPIPFNNYGFVELQSGNLSLAGGGLNNTTMDLETGATLNLTGGTFTSSAASSIAGAGNLTVNGATANLAGLVNLSGNYVFASGTANFTGDYFCTNNTVTISGGTANFSGTGTVTPAVLNQSNGTLSGTRPVTVLNQMTWSGGTMTGSSRTVIPPGVTLNISGSLASLTGGRILENGGTTLWTSGGLQATTSTVITNRAGALFQISGAGNVTAGLGGGRIDNTGTFRKTSTGTTSVDSLIPFNNYGSVELQSGILTANGGFNSTPNSQLHCFIAGATAGTGHGRLQVPGSITLNGLLSVSLTNGFIPAINNTFTLLTAGSRNGAFGNFAYPSNAVTMLLSNTANSVIVTVTAVAPAQPVLLPPELIGSDVKLTWTSVSNINYRLEFNPNLSPSNWTALPGDVMGVSNTASKLDPLATSNRLYRVRVLP